MTLPDWVVRGVRALVPGEFATDLLDDLEDGYQRRLAEGGRATARRWLLVELARLPWLRMRRQARRMRAAGTRREVSTRPGKSTGRVTTGLRLAVRSLRQRPSYTVVALLTLTASIGAATLVFSVLEAVLLRPLPYEAGERVHRIFTTSEEWRNAPQQVLRDAWDRLDLTEDMVEALRGQVRGVEALGAYTNATRRLDDGGEPVRLPGAMVLEGFFETLPLAPVLGRLPSATEMRAGQPVVVLGERLWTSRYGRDSDVLGRTVLLDGVTYTVVGVLPSTFAVPDELSRWWTPVPPDFADGRTDAAVFQTLVRTAPGVEPEEALQSVMGVADALAETNPRYAGMGVRFVSLGSLVVDSVDEGLRLLFGSVALVVLIASVNLANLVVARGARRRGELAMRAALGASRLDLVAAVLSETVVLCVAGGALGVLVATQLLDPFMSLLAWSTPDFPRADQVSVNGVVLLFATGVAMLTALLSGLGPALAASRRSPWEALQQGRRSRGGRGTRRTQRTLLLVEAGLAVVLLGIAGLLTRSALHVAAIDPGYDSESVAYLAVETSGGGYETAAEARALGDDLEATLARLPEASMVARASALPGLGGANGRLVWPSGETMESGDIVWVSSVSPEYFDVMGISMFGGRTFTASDGPDDPDVVVVSERFAERYFPGQAADQVVGRTVEMGTGTRMEGGAVVAEGSVELTVVGVVDDVRQLALVFSPDPMIYLPITQTSERDAHLILRTTGPPQDVLEAARVVIHDHDPTLLVTEADVLHHAMRRTMAALDVRLALILSLAGLAAFLTVVGIYGVVAYVVSDQVHEIGLRMALGARRHGESRRMVRHALAPVAVGGGLGLIGVYAASGLVESGLFEVEPFDPLTYVTVLAGLLSVTMLAAWLPARRAASVDPMRVLNEE